MLETRDYFTGSHGIATAAIDGPAHGERGGVTSIFEPEYAAMWRRPHVVDDMVRDWRATLDELLALGEFDPGAVGWHGLSFGSMLGIPYLAVEPRVAVAALGACGLRGPSVDRAGISERLASDAPRVTCPLLYHVQWDDERFDRDSALELSGLLGAADKRLQSTPGRHAGATPEARGTLRTFLLTRLEALHAASGAISSR
jgi:dienelactone hydrolase